MEDGSMDLKKIYLKKNLADSLIKSVNTNKYLWYRSSYGPVEI
jgi:hypothetical protein